MYRRDHGIKKHRGTHKTYIYIYIYIYIQKLRNLGRVSTGEVEGQGGEEE